MIRTESKKLNVEGISQARKFVRIIFFNLYKKTGKRHFLFEKVLWFQTKRGFELLVFVVNIDVRYPNIRTMPTEYYNGFRRFCL